jgi:hypothetical protein
MFFAVARIVYVPDENLTASTTWLIHGCRHWRSALSADDDNDWRAELSGLV